MKKNDSQMQTYRYLMDLLSNIEDRSHLSQLFEVLMTEKEQQELINRLKIFAYLQQGISQREISAKLGVGIATVSRGAKVFRRYPIEELLPHLDKVIDAAQDDGT